jgi:hypothetical protein
MSTQETPNWFYVDSQGEAQGPLLERDLDVLLRTKEIDFDTLVWKEGFQEWTALGGVTTFVENIAEDDIVLAMHTRPLVKEAPVQSEAEQVRLRQRRKEHKKNMQKKQKDRLKSRWYNPRINTNIYIQGLPLDITSEELLTFASKAGIVRLDKFTGEPKMKLYKDDTGSLKGDGLISFLKVESVELALTLLDKQEVRPGFRVRVEPVTFATFRLSLNRRETTSLEHESLSIRSSSSRTRLSRARCLTGLKKARRLTRLGYASSSSSTCSLWRT